MLIERALAPLFPAWALRRLQARMAFDIAARAYDAAKPARATKNWRAPGTSARAEDGPALAVLRNRSRDLVRNNPWPRCSTPASRGWPPSAGHRWATRRGAGCSRWRCRRAG